MEKDYQLWLAHKHNEWNCGLCERLHLSGFDFGKTPKEVIAILKEYGTP